MHGGRNVLSSLMALRGVTRLQSATWSSSAARYSGVPSYTALFTSTSSLYSIRFLTGSQCNCRSIVIRDCRSPRQLCMTIRAHTHIYHHHHRRRRRRRRRHHHHHHCAAIVSRGWAKASACCFHICLSCATLCQTVPFQ